MIFGVRSFFGIVPRLSKHQKPAEVAAVAENVDLTHGTLKAFREPKLVGAVDAGSRILFANNCCYYGFANCVSVAEWLPNCPKAFVTGRTTYPEVMELRDDCTAGFRRLGVPQPRFAPRVSTAPATDLENAREVAYVVTFVNRDEAESAPSPASQDVLINDGQTVSITFDYDPSPEYAVDRLRLYRRETGFSTGAEKENAFQTEYMLIADMPITADSHTDNTKIKDVGMPISTRETSAPPVGLRGITSVYGTGVLAGYVGNKVYFSENLQPHNWPVYDELTLDDQISGIASFGNLLVVATEGRPYVITTDTNCTGRDCRSVRKLDYPMPHIACDTGRGIITTPAGVVYVSSEGLVLISGSSAPLVVTSSEFSADDWRALRPETGRLAWSKGALYFASEAITFVLWMDTATYADAKYKRLVTLTDRPVDMFQARSGELLLLDAGGQVRQWNAGDTLRPYLWRSSPINSGYYAHFTRVKASMEQGRTKFTLTGGGISTSRDLSSGDTMVPLDRINRHREHSFELMGTGEITSIYLGASSNDISNEER